ncbi:MAG: sigma-70 family RNA polymerase sigma factor [Ruminococcus sp.]|nr:sigma-70 family RNA polymerase sigma factor [Ruminococcus sp.]
MTDSEYRALFSESPEKAQRSLFDEYYRYVYSVVYSRLRAVASKEDIEECISDVFADVYAYCSREGARDGDLKGIISTVSNRRAVNMFHSLSVGHGKTVSYDEACITDISDDNRLESDYDKEEMRSIFLKCIGELGEPDSTIIIQKYYFQRSSKETGELLKMSSSAVRVRSGRALKKLKKLLLEHGINFTEV